MRYRALCTDYDGTVAHHGTIDDDTLTALQALKRAGRALLLVTGRELDDLQRVCPHLDIFDNVVAENGALLYTPATRTERVLCEPPPAAFAATLRARGVERISEGRVIVATWEPHEKTVLETIRDLGLELQVIFNKGAVMILPSGANKASGLKAALVEMGLSPHNAIGIGDAENDHALLTACECGVAVANAVPLLKERADLTTTGKAGEGVREIIAAVIADDLASFEPRLTRHRVPVGVRDDRTPVTVPAYCDRLLIAGADEGGGDTWTLVTGLLEQLAARAYQFSLIDPLGRYPAIEPAVVVGDAHHAPTVDELLDLLHAPDHSAQTNLTSVLRMDRQAFVAALLPRLTELRTQAGRPHWLVIDEAQSLLPTGEGQAAAALSQLRGMSATLVTHDARQLPPAAIDAVTTCIAVGADPVATLRAFCEARRVPVPEIAGLASSAPTDGPAVGGGDARGRDAGGSDANTNAVSASAPAAPRALDRGHAIIWRPVEAEPAHVFRPHAPRTERRRAPRS